MDHEDPPAIKMEPLHMKIILAPLQGFTDMTYRTVFASHFSGVDEALAPFISTMGQGRLKPSRIKDVAPENNPNLFVVPQILGNVAEDFIFLADHLYAMGHQKINWNLGCPHSKIAKKRRGSGLLMYPEAIDRFLDTVLPKLSNTLSVKIRLGRKSKTEIHQLLPVLDQYPLDEIILHPRTGEQMYTGHSDHDAFAAAVKNSRHPFVYNGDITSVQAFNQVRQKFPDIHQFMIGRGILANPLLAEQIKKIPGNADAIARIKNFHDDLFENYKSLFAGPSHLIGRMKGFWSYMGLSFVDSHKQLKPILKTQSIDHYLKMTDNFFNSTLEYCEDISKI